jgi:CHAT domain-containing protein
VPDQGLHGIPWALLPAGGEPLVERCEVAVAPSATLALALRERAGGRPVAAWRAAVAADPVYGAADPRLGGAAGGDEVALPRLAETRREAAAVARWRPAALRIEGVAATRERVLAPDFRGRELLHFAAHARTETEPVGLALSLRDAQGRPRDGWLRLPDLYRLDGPAELVILSACASGLGRAVAGEGLLSLTRGFFSAGARRVVATLWSVEDAASAELMEIFYAELFGAGRTPAAALRAAQRAQRRKPHRSAPEHWAGYVLEGEWR